MSEPRNIFLIIADDLFSIEVHRNSFGVPLHVPHYDRLTRDGVTFRNAFCAVALCNPSRTSIMTGQNPFRTGVHFNMDAWNTRVSGRDTIFRGVKEAGWKVLNIGKTLHGRFLDKTDVADYLDYYYERGTRSTAGNLDANTVPAMIERIHEHRGSTDKHAFFLGITDPHAPFLPRDYFKEFYPLDDIVAPEGVGNKQLPRWSRQWLRVAHSREMRRKDELRKQIQGYLANVSQMDHSLGILYDTIKLCFPDAVIVFTSDHGFSLGAHDHFGKFTLWDQAARVPLVIVDPRSAQSGRQVDQVVSSLDIGPTLLDYAGAEGYPLMDGESIRSLVQDSNAASRGYALTTMFGSVSYRDRNYRYTLYEDGEVELFDTLADSSNQTNLAKEGEFAYVLTAYEAKLIDAFAKWLWDHPKFEASLVARHGFKMPAWEKALKEGKTSIEFRPHFLRD